MQTYPKFRAIEILNVIWSLFEGFNGSIELLLKQKSLKLLNSKVHNTLFLVMISFPCSPLLWHTWSKLIGKQFWQQFPSLNCPGLTAPCWSIVLLLFSHCLA